MSKGTGDPCICGETETWHPECYAKAQALRMAGESVTKRALVAPLPLTKRNLLRAARYAAKDSSPTAIGAALWLDAAANRMIV